MRLTLCVKRISKLACAVCLGFIILSILSNHGNHRVQKDVPSSVKEGSQMQQVSLGRRKNYVFLNLNPDDFRIEQDNVIVKSDQEQVPSRLENERKLQSLKSEAPPVNRSKAKLSDSPTELKRVKNFGINIYLYTAIVGNSSRNASWDRIVIQGWENKTLANKTNVCCVLYQSGVLQTFTMLKKIHWTFNDVAKLPVKQYICPNHPKLKGDSPTHATVTTKKCHKLFRWYVKTEFAYKHPGQIAVCTKLAYGNLPADDVLSWFEVHKLMGVKKVLTYAYKLNANTTKVLKHYETEGMAEVIPFYLPKEIQGGYKPKVGDKNVQSWNDEQIPVYDCLERLKGYDFIATLDLDEYLIPTRDKNWFGLFRRLLGKTPNAAGFRFLVRLHITTWGPTDNSTEFKIGRYANCTAPMADRTKHVTIPERLVPGGMSTHAYTGLRGFGRANAPEDLATIHHFRACRKEWIRNNSTKCDELSRYRDNSVSKLYRKVEKMILRVKSNVLLE